VQCASQLQARAYKIAEWIRSHRIGNNIFPSARSLQLGVEAQINLAVDNTTDETAFKMARSQN
jgi:hypothetical protein